MEFNPAEELDKYQTSPTQPYVMGQLCFVLNVVEWDTVNQNYKVKLKYPNPTFQNMLEVNLTAAEFTSSFDFTTYNKIINTSMIEIMSGVSEEVIDGIKGDTNRNSYQLRIAPTYS